jgi:hypothetical protein
MLILLAVIIIIAALVLGLAVHPLFWLLVIGGIILIAVALRGGV